MGNVLGKHKKAFKKCTAPVEIAGVCSANAFRVLIQREQARSDRGHGLFSMVVFRFNPEQKLPTNRNVITSIKNRIRVTDTIGWIEDLSVGVLLTDTDRSEATLFLKDVLPAIENAGPVPDYQIYTYPADSAQCNELPIPAAQPIKIDSMGSEYFFNEITARTPFCGRQVFESLTAGLALLILSPILLLIALGIKYSSPGPVLCCQQRIGHKGVEFRCYKFRTMHANAEIDVHTNYFNELMMSDKPMTKLDKEDNRIFKFGRLLRSSSLDELPQLFNVMKGEMSFIGPRPALPEEYRNYLPWYCHRVDVLPGLTGLWQVSGKNKTTFREMMRLDNRYARHQSMRMNIRIVFKTPAVILTQFLEDKPQYHLFLRGVSEFLQTEPFREKRKDIHME